MILKFFNKDKQSNNNSDLLNVTCLMIHAAKIDENYTDREKSIVKNTIKKLICNQNDLPTPIQVGSTIGIRRR